MGNAALLCSVGMGSIGSRTGSRAVIAGALGWLGARTHSSVCPFVLGNVAGWCFCGYVVKLSDSLGNC